MASTLISSFHQDCLDSFQKLLSVIQTSAEMRLGSELMEESRNTYGRYKVWAGNVGAGHQGDTYRLSLDYRLRDASFYRDRLVELLVELCSVNQKMSSILEGGETPFEEFQVGEESETETDLSDEISSSSSSGADNDDSTLNLRSIRAVVASNIQKSAISRLKENYETPNIERHNQNVPITELARARDTVKDIITSLYKISTTIRRPLPSDRDTRSLKIDVRHFTEFDRRYVQEKFPLADPNVIERMARGITRRRQLLQYRKEHNDHMHAMVTEPWLRESQGEHGKRGVEYQTPTAGITSTGYPPTNTPGNLHHLSSKTTTFVPRTTTSIDESQSVADTESSYQSHSSHREIINIPPMPNESLNKEIEDFECPYCGVLCKFISETAWKNHVLGDLEPYMCTFPQCSKPDQMYTSRSEWYQHEVEEHRYEWYCNVAGHEAFSSQHEFSAHIAQKHPSFDTAINYSSLFRTCRRPLGQTQMPCPLCKTIPKHFQSHLEKHQMQMALFAIPRSHYEERSSEAGFTDSNVGMAPRAGINLERSSNTAAHHTDSEHVSDSTVNSGSDYILSMIDEYDGQDSGSYSDGRMTGAVTAEQSTPDARKRNRIAPAPKEERMRLYHKESFIDNEFLGAGIKATVQSVTHGTYNTSQACLILFSFDFKTRVYGERYKNASIKICFEKHPSAALAQRNPGVVKFAPRKSFGMEPSDNVEGRIKYNEDLMGSVPTGPISVGPELAVPKVLDLERVLENYLFKATGNFWCTKHGAEWDVVYWLVNENKNSQRGIPTRFNAAVIVEAEGPFQATAEIRVDTPFVQASSSYPWSRADPITFMPGKDLGKWGKSLKFEELGEEDWRKLLHSEEDSKDISTEAGSSSLSKKD